MKKIEEQIDMKEKTLKVLEDTLVKKESLIVGQLKPANIFSDKMIQKKRPRELKINQKVNPDFEKWTSIRRDSYKQAEQQAELIYKKIVVDKRKKNLPTNIHKNRSNLGKKIDNSSIVTPTCVPVEKRGFSKERVVVENRRSTTAVSNLVQNKKRTDINEKLGII